MVLSLPWYSLTPSPSPTERGAPNGVRLFFIRQKDTDKDIVTYEHKIIVTEFLDIMPRDIIFQ